VKYDRGSTKRNQKNKRKKTKTKGVLRDLTESPFLFLEDDFNDIKFT